MKSLKKTIVFGLILSALGLFYYIYEIKGGKARQEAKEKVEKIFSVEPSKIDKIVISSKDEVIELEKKDEAWLIVSPLQARGDKEAISSMTMALGNEKRLRVIAEKPSSLEDFGLKQPAIKVSFRARNGAAEKTLYLGDRSPAGGGVYSKKEGSDEVILLSNTFYGKFDKKLADLRDKTILNIEPVKIASFELETQGAKAIAVKTGEKEWRLKEPVQAKGNFYRIRDALEKLGREKLKEFVEEAPKDLSKYGLDKPALKITVAEEGGAKASSVIFGSLDKDKKGTYAKVIDANNVIMIDEKIWDNLPKTASDIRDRTLLEFEREKVAEVGLKTDSEDILVRRLGKDDWEIVRPIKAKGDDVRMGSLLWDFKDLSVKEFVEEDPADLSKYGIGPDSKKLSVLVEGAKEPQTLLLGKKEDSRGTFYAQLLGNKQVYGVDKSDLETIFRRTLHDLRYKKLLTFKNDLIKKIDLKLQGQDFLFERRRGGWKIKKPEIYTTKDWKVNMVLWAVNDLEFKEIVDQEAKDLSQYGLDKPEVIVKLWLDGGKKLDEVLVGKSVAGKDLVYLKLASRPAVYAVDKKFMEDIERDIGELQS